MTTAEFLRALEEALEVEPGSLSVDQAVGEAGSWDSMAALVFMAVADEQLGVAVTGDQIAQCKTVGDLLALLGDKITP